MSTPHKGSQEISFNLAITDPSLRAGVDKYNSHSLLHGDHYVTIIKPEYRNTFRDGVLHIMRGLGAATIGPARLPDGRIIQATIFGFTVNFASTKPQTTLLVPNVHKVFVPDLENPMGAIHSFHQGLISNTNVALEVLNTPFVLAPIPE